jgi:hypothetical protein
MGGESGSGRLFARHVATLEDGDWPTIDGRLTGGKWSQGLRQRALRAREDWWLAVPRVPAPAACGAATVVLAAVKSLLVSAALVRSHVGPGVTGETIKVVRWRAAGRPGVNGRATRG